MREQEMVMARIMAAAVAAAALGALMGCSTYSASTAGSSATARPGYGVVESIRDAGVAAPPATASIQGTATGTSVYDAPTYAQPSVHYPSAIADVRPRDLA